MLIYIVRHGDSGLVTRGMSDADRKLTSKGELQAQRIGIALRMMNEVPEVVFTSPLVRALQTAEIAVHAMADKRSEPPVHTSNSLTLGVPVGDVLRAMPGDLHSVMMVGHNPTLGALVGILVGGLHGTLIDIENGSIICLETYGSPRPGTANLNYFLREKVVAVIAKSV